MAEVDAPLGGHMAPRPHIETSVDPRTSAPDAQASFVAEVVAEPASKRPKVAANGTTVSPAQRARPASDADLPAPPTTLAGTSAVGAGATASTELRTTDFSTQGPAAVSEPNHNVPRAAALVRPSHETAEVPPDDTPADPLADNPPHCADAWARLLARFPPPAQFLEEIELMFDELHCPVRALQPSTPPRHLMRSHLEYSYQAYSAHAPGWPSTSAADRMGSSVLQRRIIMNKNLRPQAAPSHAVSRRPLLNGGTARLRHGSRDALDLSDRKCPLCMQIKAYTDYGAGLKARYCRECEKLRWMGRKRGLKVEALRYTLERYADRLEHMSHAEIVHKACDIFATPDVTAADASRAVPDSDRGDGSVDVQMAASGEDSGTRHSLEEARPAFESDHALTSGGEDTAHDGNLSEGAGVAKHDGNDADVAAMAALLESGNNSSAPAVAMQLSPERKCALCYQNYRPCIDAPNNLCGRCEDLKKIVKSSGHTLDEFKKGLASGHVTMESPDREAIDSGLRAMLLGQPAAPKSNGGSRAARALSRETP